MHSREKAELEAAQKEVEMRSRHYEQVQASKIKQLKDELHTLHEQLETTQQLYAKVRDGRDLMREEMERMKSELDIYHKNLQDSITVEKGGARSRPESILSPTGEKNLFAAHDTKVEDGSLSAGKGAQEDSFNIDDIRREFEGFDEF